MTEPNADPSQDALPPPPPPQRSRARFLTPLALLLLAGGIAVVWYRTTLPPNLRDIGQRLTAIEARVTRLEQPHPAAAANGADLTPRVEALEQRTDPDPVPHPDLTPRVEALERRPIPDLASLQSRIAGLEQRPIADTEALFARVTALEKIVARDDRSSRLEGAAIALAAGRKLGNIPGMPPALARFASVAPPTEAALRLKFPAAERAALEASRPDDRGRPIVARLLARAEELVTVRQGDRVLVGDPAAGVLVRARKALEAGDLSGAVDVLGVLRGDASVAMSGWLTDAVALRDARAALADMAAQP